MKGFSLLNPGSPDGRPLHHPYEQRTALYGAAVFLGISAAQAATTSINSATSGTLGNGSNDDGVVLGSAGPLLAPGDTSAYYSGGTTRW